MTHWLQATELVVNSVIFEEILGQANVLGRARGGTAPPHSASASSFCPETFRELTRGGVRALYLVEFCAAFLTDWMIFRLIGTRNVMFCWPAGAIRADMPHSVRQSLTVLEGHNATDAR